MKRPHFAALAVAFALPLFVVAQTEPVKPKPGLLSHVELEKLLPPSVYFEGQSATVQVRNSGGVRFAGGAVVLAVKVDTGGYSSSIAERYQDYLIAETALVLGDGQGAKTLAPGAYGIGFLPAGLVVMDIGGHTLFTVPTQTDTVLKRPTPLQVLAQGDGFRLYSGRSFVSFVAGPGSGE